MSGSIDGLPPLRDVIQRYDLAAKKHLGQNFLLDLNLTSKIARLAGDLKNYDVLEIGPGPGGLTRSLLAEGARHVLVVEKDLRCIAALEEIKAVYPERLSILHADAHGLDVTPYLKPPVCVVANLPYNIGTELLVRWLSPAHWPPFWQSLTLMFQKEVAERIVAPAGERSYGRLSILAQWRSDARIVMRLPPEAFRPQPKVHSAIVHLERLKVPRFPADADTLSYITALAFSQRRKMLRSSLKSLCSGMNVSVEQLLSSAEISPTVRAEGISIEKFCALAHLYYEIKSRENPGAVARVNLP